MFIVALRLPKDTTSSPKRFFAGFHRNGVPDWSHTQKVPGNVRLLTFREAKQVIEDLKRWYAEQQPDYECYFRTYEVSLTLLAGG